MKILTVDTSTNCSSVALSNGSTLLGESILGEDRSSSGRLPDAIDKLLAAAGLTPDGLDAFATSLGPGSFTGVRVGIAMVKGLALATGKPTLGFSSLAMLAMNLPHCAFQVAPLFDARKQEVYAGLYRVSELAQPLRDDAVLSPKDFLASIDAPTVFLGEGALRYRELIETTLGELAIFPAWHCHLPRAAAGASLALDAAQAGNFIPLPLLNPRYLRASEAEIAKRRREAA